MNQFHDGDLHERSTKDLIQELFGEGKKLIRDEVELAKVEAKDEVKKASVVARDGAVAGVLAHTAFLCLAATLIAGLSTLMPIWVAALLVTGLLGGAAAYFFARARDEARKVHPAKAAEKMKEDLRWTKDKISSEVSRRHASA